MAAMLIEEEVEGEGEEEWMRLLEGYDNEPQELETSAKAAKDGAEEPEAQDLEELEVADEGDAAALLAAVKQRLGESGQTAQYHEFLTAISQATVDREAALAILKGHPDLISAFSRCFAPAQEEAEFGAEAGPQDSLAEHRGTGARAAQLVHLAFANVLKAGHEHEQAKMLEYVKKCAAQAAFPRRLVILRGPPGLGKSSWALKELRQEAVGGTGLDQAETLALRLTHICSTDDFFMQFKGATPDMQYNFNPRSLFANHAMNEARVRLGMEMGIDPLYVDNTNMRLWEMRPYVMLADRMGYVVTVVSPSEISPGWNDLDFLMPRSQEKHNKTTEKYVGRASLEAMLESFESLADGTDPRPAIRASQKPDEEDGRFGATASEYSTKLPPSAILYKFEKLLKEGTQILRYTPPDGKGWGVNGELYGEWHSFREKGDGSCCYDDRLHWWTEDPEQGWSLDELAMLADLRKVAMDLPQAELPTAATHPSLFAKQKSSAAKASAGPPKAAKAAPAKPPQKAAEAPAKQVSRAGVWHADSEPGAAAVPASRVERFKHRMKLQREREAKEVERFEDAVDLPAPRVVKKAKAKAGPKVPPPVDPFDVEEMDDLPPGAPTEQEEVSASTFLAAVKARLTEWGKVEQYHEFILALSGTVDAKAAVRILKGHDDLLRVFRRKFAPQADLSAIKQELREEDGDAPHPPSHPPSMGGVKQELLDSRRTPFTPAGGSSLARVKAEAGHDGPRPPAGPRGVKEELGRLVKSEVKAEDMPRPPKYNPNAPRGTVTIGDDSDEEMGEASIAAAVKKGREECIAQLAKTIFRRERTTGEGARPRLAMVRYATKVSSRPRFPRELFILRGAPGTGKTEYAMQQLGDYVEVEADEELAARLTHVCSADDFFEQFKGDDAVYKFEVSRLESAHCRNETRARLAMEAGIHPLYIDCANMKLWEMRPYVLLAERLGYVTTLIEPQDICEKWDDVAFLASANDTSDRRRVGKVVNKSMLAAMVKAFEHQDLEDPIKAIRGAHRPEGPRAVEAVPMPPEGVKKPVGLQPSWMKVKEEALERAGQKRPAAGQAMPPRPMKGPRPAYPSGMPQKGGKAFGKGR